MFRVSHVEWRFQQYMAHAVIQVSINFKEQHTLPGITGKGVIVKKHVGWVLVKKKKKKRAQQKEGGKASKTQGLETENSKRAQNLENSEMANGQKQRAWENVAEDEAGKVNQGRRRGLGAILVPAQLPLQATGNEWKLLDRETSIAYGGQQCGGKGCESGRGEGVQNIRRPVRKLFQQPLRQ